MTLLIGLRPWNHKGPLLTSPYQWGIVFVGLLLCQLALQALVDPEMNAKLREWLEQSLARDKVRREFLDRKHEEAKRRLKEAWQELKRKLKGEKKTEL